MKAGLGGQPKVTQQGWVRQATFAEARKVQDKVPPGLALKVRLGRRTTGGVKAPTGPLCVGTIL